MKKLKAGLKWLFRPLAELARKITYKLMRNVISHLDRTIKSSVTANVPPIPYVDGEPVRIMFLFQAASLWPSWESFYEACMADDRFDVKFCFLNELYGDTTQMLTAQKFLDQKGLEYTVYEDSVFSRFHPHVLVMQTPYDFGHRRLHVRSATFKRKGTRIVYIPYGIELADTEHARDAHFMNPVVLNAWRVFTFSERMREDYFLQCPNRAAVKCVGHPKFDSLYHKERFPILEEVARRAGKRKILVWHVHFPKLIPMPEGGEVMSTPELEEYVQFARYITTKTELFVVLLPHPKFLDGEGDLGVKAKEVVELMTGAENAYVDWADDYRNTLLNCDAFITDRSALMVEAVTVGVPILYMRNARYDEPLTAAIEPIIDSYDRGTGFAEMKEFTESFLRGDDPHKEERERAFRESIPYYDGKCGERIKEHIVDALYAENRDQTSEQIELLRTEVDRLNQKLDYLLEQRGTPVSVPKKGEE